MPVNEPPASDLGRIKTDGSLSVERKKTDDAFATATKTTERETDREVEKSRAATDKLVAKDRAKSALSLESDDLSDQVREERRRADVHTADERDQADRTLQRERSERRFDESALFADQRLLTDQCLRFERKRTDWAAACAARQLTDEQAALTLANDAVTTRDQFLAIVSHDLRGPLGNISLCADELTTLCAEKGFTADEAHLVDIIRRQAANMSRLIVDLLDTEHMVSGRLELLLDACDVTALVQDVVESFKYWAVKQGITLTTGCPQPAVMGRCDRERIWQVLSNLVGNALKFTPDGGTVTVRAELVEATVRVAVTDTGPGIAEDQQGRIFERFSQIKSRDRRGLGLGLFIAKWIVEAHHGRLCVESKIGVGSTFVFTLPPAP